MSILLVGKGPSAVRAQQYNNGEVAVINDAAKLIDGEVDYCFFTDMPQIEAARSEWPRVKRFVCPTWLHSGGKKVEGAIPDGFPMDRLTRFRAWLVGARNRQWMRQCVRHCRVIQVCTATAAMSWLAYQGYTHIRLIGFDGGIATNAPGVRQGRPGTNYSIYLRAQRLLAEVLHNQLGVTVEWLK